MGLSPFNKCVSNPYSPPNVNPDPTKFKIMDAWSTPGYLIVEVNYPNCTNFEGDKILVFKGIASVQELLEKVNYRLDPHFTKNTICPIARFAPTKEGREMAVYFISMLIVKNQKVTHENG